jgi:2-methylisocitrate lyase-like PEP mutase family enzyme
MSHPISERNRVAFLIEVEDPGGRRWLSANGGYTRDPMPMTQRDQAERFLRQHQDDGCFVMPNAWDVGSAKMLVSAGFTAIGTTSAGIAFAQGRPDHLMCSEQARMQRDAMLTVIGAITANVAVPVNADLEGGFGDSPEAVAVTITQAIAAGAVGGNIEDYTGNREQPLYDRVLAIERIAAARAAIEASGIPFVLVARTDRFMFGAEGGFAETVERANAYREAGADCLFTPGVSDLSTIAALVREIAGPLNVVAGWSGSPLTVAKLRDAGVRRISIGGSLARSLYFRIRQAAEEMLKEGTFTFANEQVPQAELNRIFEADL